MYTHTTGICFGPLPVAPRETCVEPGHVACGAWQWGKWSGPLLRLLAACPAVAVTGASGYVDVRVPVDVWERVKEAGE
jgi:hypothetical protein